MVGISEIVVNANSETDTAGVNVTAASYSQNGVFEGAVQLSEVTDPDVSPPALYVFNSNEKVTVTYFDDNPLEVVANSIYIQ